MRYSSRARTAIWRSVCVDAAKTCASLHAQPARVVDDSGAVTGAIVCVADVTDSVRMREELEHRATFDLLTRCYNRASILQALERTLAEPRPDDSGTGVIFIDLDRFKDVNDRLGHAAGDVLLVEVARRLASCTREADLVGRIGGDEFLVVCTRVPDEATTLKIAGQLADALGASDMDLGTEESLRAPASGSPGPTAKARTRMAWWRKPTSQCTPRSASIWA